jgi:hypothetical protein
LYANVRFYARIEEQPDDFICKLAAIDLVYIVFSNRLYTGQEEQHCSSRNKSEAMDDYPSHQQNRCPSEVIFLPV